MVRPELHKRRAAPAELSRPPARPRLDAIAWKAARALEAQTDAAVEQLRAVLAQAGRPVVEIKDEKAA